MSLIVTIRSTETIEYEIPEQPGVPELEQAAHDLCPDGYQIIRIDRHHSTATARPVETRTIEIESGSDVWAAVPDGWQALSVRPA